MAAQPEVRQVIQLHPGFGRDGSRNRFFRSDFHLRMTFGLGVGFGDFAGPSAVCQRNSDGIAGFGLQCQFNFRYPFPGTGQGHDAGVLSVVIIGYGEGIVRIDVYVAAQPEVRQVIQLHAILRRNGLFFGNDGSFINRGRFCGSRSFSDLDFHSCGRRFFFHSLRLGLGLEEAEPQYRDGNRQHQQEDQQTLPSRFLSCDVQEQADDYGQHDGVEQSNQSVPVRGIIAFHLHGCAVGLGVEDIMAGFTHRLTRCIIGGINAGSHKAQHHIIPCADSKIGIHPGGIGHGRVCHHHAGKAPFTAQHICEQRAAGSSPNCAKVAVAGHDSGSAAFLHSDLKRLEIDFTHGLFIGPNGNAQAIGFLIVQGEVLGVHVHALRGSALHLGSAQLTG